MENAVKALLIAAGVLVGIMIVTLGVSLYTSLNNYVESTQKEISTKNIQQFNEQFTRYINYDEDTGEILKTLTIQDIVTAANTAYENNRKTEYYVKINIPGFEGVENQINSISADLLSESLEKQYKCGYKDVKIDNVTGRVCEVSFSE